MIQVIDNSKTKILGIRPYTNGRFTLLIVNINKPKQTFLDL
jgi:hypothetical protein